MFYLVVVAWCFIIEAFPDAVYLNSYSHILHIKILSLDFFIQLKLFL